MRKGNAGEENSRPIVSNHMQKFLYQHMFCLKKQPINCLEPNNQSNLSINRGRWLFIEILTQWPGSWNIHTEKPLYRSSGTPLNGSHSATITRAGLRKTQSSDTGADRAEGDTPLSCGRRWQEVTGSDRKWQVRGGRKEGSGKTYKVGEEDKWGKKDSWGFQTLM